MLKQRVISGIVLAVIFIPLLWFSHIPILLNLMVAALAAISVYESLVATKYVESKLLMWASILFAVSVPIVIGAGIREGVLISIFVFIMLIFLILILTRGKLSFEHVCVVFLLAFTYAICFSAITLVRYISFNEFDVGKFYIFFVFISAWGTDVMAYFTGMLFGKHKLIPEISPKKTVEGAVGGVIGCIGMFILGAYFVTLFGYKVNWLGFAAAGLVCSVCGMIGDLAASVVKRTFGVKDFGSVIPGHGGILDRFDSVVFTAPSLYIFLLFFDLITL